MRVQVPAYTDQWMRGDRYGRVVRETRGKRQSAVGGFDWCDIYRVKLDKSGRTVSFWADDCTVVD